jgi:hypothetical protein
MTDAPAEAGFAGPDRITAPRGAPPAAGERRPLRSAPNIPILLRVLREHRWLLDAVVTRRSRTRVRLGTVAALTVAFGVVFAVFNHWFAGLPGGDLPPYKLVPSLLNTGLGCGTCWSWRRWRRAPCSPA